jgi:hypothetical protein
MPVLPASPIAKGSPTSRQQISQRTAAARGAVNAVKSGAAAVARTRNSVTAA